MEDMTRPIITATAVLNKAHSPSMILQKRHVARDLRECSSYKAHNLEQTSYFAAIVEVSVDKQCKEIKNRFKVGIGVTKASTTTTVHNTSRVQYLLGIN